MNKILMQSVCAALMMAALNTQAQTLATCQPNEGLSLLNQENAPLADIQAMLALCDQQSPQDVQVLLLHGLLARKEGQASQNYQTAIAWLQKATAVAAANNFIPTLELAITYEWSGAPDKAKPLYEAILKQDPHSRAALLGSARVARAQNRWQDATQIYQNFLQSNPHDTEALAGLAWIKMANKDYAAAKKLFQQVLKINANEAQAKTGLTQIQQLTQPAAVEPAKPVICQATEGLGLLNQQKPPFASIHAILVDCDKVAPQAVETLLLQGLLARKQAQTPQQYQAAIVWLEKARTVAEADNPTPSLELAATYEIWTKQPEKAQAIYTDILKQDPLSRPALLGQARIARAQANWPTALSLYYALLKQNISDTEALDGIGWVQLAQKEYAAAKGTFEKVQYLKPDDIEAKQGLAQIQQLTQPPPPPPKPVVCKAMEGLSLLNQSNPPWAQIKEILADCHKVAPQAVETLLLHGLLIRKEGHTTQQYQEAIGWLEKAKNVAPANNKTPTLELAATYELWAKQPEKAKAIYEDILKQDPSSRAARLGIARIARAQAHWEEALSIYQNFLNNNPSDTESLNGIAWIKLANKDYKNAQEIFEKVQQIKADDAEAKIGLAQIHLLMSKPPAPAPSPCLANEGLRLLNQKNPPFAEINGILAKCHKEAPDDIQGLVLHGLVARKQGIARQNYTKAIEWLKKAKDLAPAQNDIPALELAITYEWSKQPAKAKVIYEAVLLKTPSSRAALLGLARVAQMQERLYTALGIYQKFLRENAQDNEALAGLGYIQLAQKEYPQAKATFEKLIKINPKNDAGHIGLEKVNEAIKMAQAPKPPVCDANKGLVLLNQDPIATAEIEAILAKCDKEAPTDPQGLFLHGLYARKLALTTHDFAPAIAWLQKAAAAAAVNNEGPRIELAVTYEWANEPEKAKAIYNDILVQNPQARDPLFGLGRIAQAEYRLRDAGKIYQGLLEKNPLDTEALVGLGLTNAINQHPKAAKFLYNEALKIKPDDKDALSGLKDLEKKTRFLLAEDNGYYSVVGEHSEGTNLFLSGYLNATDQLLMLATHNTKEIGAAFFTTPTLLPKNSVLLGFQRQLPNRYGFGVNYDYRERSQLPLEHRVAVNANFYLVHDFQVFGGARDGFPSPWKNQLYFAGMTLFTNTPINYTLTGFWANNEIGGRDNSYSFDLSKEFPNRSFYDIGAAYDPVIPSWQVHGRFIWMIFKNQGIQASYEHYFFNASNFVTFGFRVYWN